jgi:hypothetical protein
MRLLFDTSPEEPRRARKPRQKKAEPKASAEPVEIRIPESAILPLGRLDSGVHCGDTTCRAECHDITDEDRGYWRIECCFCGTGQWVPVVKGHLPPPAEGADFVLRGGRFDGQTIGEVARSSRGMEYIAWAAEEHPRQAVKKACRTWLAESGQVG